VLKHFGTFLRGSAVIKTERLHPILVWVAIISIVVFVPGMAESYYTSHKGKQDRNRLVRALTQTHIATVVADEKMDIIHRNPKADEIFGVSLAGKRICDLVPEGHGDVHAEGVERWKEKGGVRAEPIHCKITLPDGTERDVQIALWSTHCNGEVIFVAEIK